MPDDSNITPSNEDAFKRKFEAIKVDVAALRQRIAEQAAAFSADPAEQRDYRRTLITLLISDALHTPIRPRRRREAHASRHGAGEAARGNEGEDGAAQTH